MSTNQIGIRQSYLITVSGCAYQGAILGATGYVASGIRLIDSDSNVLQDLSEIALWDAGATTSKQADASFSMCVPFNCSSDKTVRLQGMLATGGGATSPSLGIRIGTKLSVVRIG